MKKVTREPEDERKATEAATVCTENITEITVSFFIISIISTVGS
ncbi:hypothetical protein [Haloarchaeobius baliensis]